MKAHWIGLTEAAFPMTIKPGPFAPAMEISVKGKILSQDEMTVTIEFEHPFTGDTQKIVVQK